MRLVRTGKGKWCKRQAAGSVYSLDPPCCASCHCSQTLGKKLVLHLIIRVFIWWCLSSTRCHYCPHSNHLMERGAWKLVCCFFLAISAGLIKTCLPMHRVSPVSLTHQSYYISLSLCSPWVPTVWDRTCSWLKNYGQSRKAVFNACIQLENIYF